MRVDQLSQFTKPCDLAWGDMDSELHGLERIDLILHELSTG